MQQHLQTFMGKLLFSQQRSIAVIYSIIFYNQFIYYAKYFWHKLALSGARTIQLTVFASLDWNEPIKN